MPPPIARKWEIGSSSVRDREIALSVCQPSQRARGMEFVVVPAAGAPEARPRVAQAALPCVAHAKIATNERRKQSPIWRPKTEARIGIRPIVPLFFCYRAQHNARARSDLALGPRPLLECGPSSSSSSAAWPLRRHSCLRRSSSRRLSSAGRRGSPWRSARTTLCVSRSSWSRASRKLQQNL